MLNEVYVGNTLRAWLNAALTFGIVLVLLLALKEVLGKRLKTWSQRTASNLDDLIVDVLGRTKLLFLAVLALYVASLSLTLSETVHGVFSVGVRLAIIFQLGLWASAAATRLIQGAGGGGSRQAPRAAIVFTVRILLWSVVLLVALDSMGVNVTALITGLGVGGVAVALATQNILGDLFSSMSITLDKPFVPGDFIAVDTLMGTVEHVGLKTTRVRSLSGEQLIFANTDLLKSRIRNLGRMQERRAVFTVGVTYQTPHATLERIPGMIREIIEGMAGTRFDRSHFQMFGASALVFETVYFVTDPDYNRYMDIQQAVNLEICRRFEREGIAFAYPTQTVFVQPSGPASSRPG